MLNLDATDDPPHGQQEGRFFHGYYREYCYLPLYIFCGEFLLCARLRTAEHGEGVGVVEEVERIVGQIRARWPQVEIALRADSAFCREELMNWCEGQGVHYILGLARNKRLESAAADWNRPCARPWCNTAKPAMPCGSFATYRIAPQRPGVRRGGRVVGKAGVCLKRPWQGASAPSKAMVTPPLPSLACLQPPLTS